MADEVPIPREIWDKILAFLRDGKTGEITLYVNEGRIRDSAFLDRVRARPV